MEKGRVFTIGHSTRTLNSFIDLLNENGVTGIADIRTIPRSRYNPQFNKETLSGALKEHGIKYVHLKLLGGLRHPAKESPNTGWRSKAFQGFSDYMQKGEFEDGMRELQEIAEKERVALMCAEAVPWRCHRSLVADALLIRCFEVIHILGLSHTQHHTLTPFARVEGTRITYPPVSEGR